MQKALAAVPVVVFTAVSMQAVAANASTSSKSTAPVVVANWAMNDGSDGVMTDSSAYNNDGSLSNVAIGQLDGSSPIAFGFPLLTGSASRVVVPDDPTLDPDDQ